MAILEFVAAAPGSDYFWIGYSKGDAGWTWEDKVSSRHIDILFIFFTIFTFFQPFFSKKLLRNRVIQSTNSYTNWDTANGEPSTNSVAKCAYVDTTTAGLYW